MGERHALFDEQVVDQEPYRKGEQAERPDHPQGPVDDPLPRRVDRFVFDDHLAKCANRVADAVYEQRDSHNQKK